MWLGRTGVGRCSRLDANLSPGDSIPTAGAPKVTLRSDARAPPSEWPVTQMLEWGYMYVRLLYRFFGEGVSRGQDTTHTGNGIRVLTMAVG